MVAYSSFNAIYKESLLLANHKSAKKRIRQTIRTNLIRKSRRSRLRTLEKSLHELLEKKDKTAAIDCLKVFNKEMEMSVRKGVHHRNKASRKKSRLSVLVNAL